MRDLVAGDLSGSNDLALLGGVLLPPVSMYGSDGGSDSADDSCKGMLPPGKRGVWMCSIPAVPLHAESASLSSWMLDA